MLTETGRAAGIRGAETGDSGMGLRDENRTGPGARWGLGRLEVPGGGGIGDWLPREQRPGLRVSARGCRGAEDRAGPRGSGNGDLGPAVCDATCAEKRPSPRRPLFLTSQQATGLGWRRSAQSRASRLPGAERSQAPIRNARTDPGSMHFRLPPPLPPPPPAPRPVPRARHSLGAPPALRRASRDW